MGDEGIPSIGPGAPSELIEAWSEALERKDPGTWSHCRRVAALATILARALSLNDEEIQIIADGALLHEIGKLAEPSASVPQEPKTAPQRTVLKMASRNYDGRGVSEGVGEAW